MRPAVAAPADADTLFPAPVGFVNDRAGVLDDSSRARLESFLDQVKRKTGVQFAVLVLPTTAPLDPITYKTEAYRRWFQGNRRSLLLLVALAEHRVAFETGYELEGILPDGLEARIIRREMTPRFRENDYAGGIRQGVLRTAAIVAKDRGVTLEWDGSELRYGEEREPAVPTAVLVLFAFIILLAFFSLVAAGRPGRRPGGGGGGFGGFSGGGGFGSGGGGGSGGW